MNKLDLDYQSLLKDILENGTKKKDRTGTGTISVFGRQIRHKMSDGFPLLTTKRIHWKSVVTELLWFIRGETNIQYLVDHDCNIWNGDALKRLRKHEDEELAKYMEANPSVFVDFQYMSEKEFIEKMKSVDTVRTDEDRENVEFAKKWGDMGPIYGKQWRSWATGWFEMDKDNGKYNVKSIDQLSNLIKDLRENPDSRRLMVNAWNPGELDQMLLPPCHYGFQVYTRELSIDERIEIGWKYIDGNEMDYDMQLSTSPTNEDLLEVLDGYNIPYRAISLMWSQRSCDTLLGLPFNIASYGLLLEIIARDVNMVPDELIGNLGDTHLYLDHVEAAELQLKREPFNLPSLKIENKEEPIDIINQYLYWWPVDFKIENYQSHPSIKANLSN